jgi:hypothetical protein
MNATTPGSLPVSVAFCVPKSTPPVKPTGTPATVAGQWDVRLDFVYGSASHTVMLPSRLIATLVLLLWSARSPHALAQDARALTWDRQSTDHFDVIFKYRNRAM